MFKKSLIAIAALGALAGSAVAADVTVYGLVDYGFNYQHVDGDTTGVDARDGFEMRSGMNSGSRFGIKGSEDLGNGLTVGFVLENGFDADTGDLGYDGRIFGRESQVYLKGGFGTLSFGRVGQLASANGSYGLLGQTSPFSSGWGDSVGQKFVTANGWSRFDNTVTYVSPDWAGFKVHAQYSFKTDTNNEGPEGKSDTDRYYGVAATYSNDSLYLVGIVDFIDYSCTNWDATQPNPKDDQYTVTLGGNYDFGFMKLYGMAQYFDNAKAIGQKSINHDGTFGGGYTYNGTDGRDSAKGYGVAIGVGVPAFGGTAKASIGYMDAESQGNAVWTPAHQDGGLTRWNVSVGYDYNLSKRTSVYTAAAYTKDDCTDYNGVDREPSTIEVMAGLIHKF